MKYKEYISVFILFYFNVTKEKMDENKKFMQLKIPQLCFGKG